MTVRLVFDKPMAAPPASPAGFSVYLNWTDQLTISAVNLNPEDPREIDLTLTAPVYGGEVKMWYMPGSVKAADSAPLAALSAVAVRDQIAPLTLACQMYLAGSSAAPIVTVLKNTYHVTMAAALSGLKPFYTYTVIADALMATYGQGYEQDVQLCSATLEALYDASDFAGYVKNRIGLADCTVLLKNAGATAAEVCRALATSYAVTLAEIASRVQVTFSLSDEALAALMLEQFGSPDVGPAIEALAGNGFTDPQIAAALRAEPLLLTDLAAAAALRQCEYSALSVAAVWQSKCENAVSAAQFLRAAGFDLSDIAAYLQFRGYTQPSDVVAVMDSAGFTAVDIASAFSGFFNAGGAYSISEMRAAGFARARIVEVMKCAPYSMTYQDMARVMNQIDLPVTEILATLMAEYQEAMQAEASQKGTGVFTLAVDYAACRYEGRLDELATTLRDAYGYTAAQTGDLVLSGNLSSTGGMEDQICAYLLKAYDVTAWRPTCSPPGSSQDPR
jgi:hypothetical protein